MNSLYENAFLWRQNCFELDRGVKLDAINAYRDFQRWSTARDLMPCSLEKFVELLAEEGGVRMEEGRAYVNGRLKADSPPPIAITEATEPEAEPAAVAPATARRGRPPKYAGAPERDSKRQVPQSGDGRGSLGRSAQLGMPVQGGCLAVEKSGESHQAAAH